MKRIVRLGEKVKDNVTGFLGVATGRCEYLNGCIRIQITPIELKDGVPQEMVWIDESQLEGYKEEKIKKTGGPRNNPTLKNPPSY